MRFRHRKKICAFDVEYVTVMFDPTLSPGLTTHFQRFFKNLFTPFDVKAGSREFSRIRA